MTIIFDKILSRIIYRVTSNAWSNVIFNKLKLLYIVSHDYINMIYFQQFCGSGYFRLV